MTGFKGESNFFPEWKVSCGMALSAPNGFLQGTPGRGMVAFWESPQLRHLGHLELRTFPWEAVPRSPVVGFF